MNDYLREAIGHLFIFNPVNELRNRILFKAACEASYYIMQYKHVMMSLLSVKWFCLMMNLSFNLQFILMFLKF